MMCSVSGLIIGDCGDALDIRQNHHRLSGAIFFLNREATKKKEPTPQSPARQQCRLRN